MGRKTENLNVKVLEKDKKALRKMAALEGEAMAVVIRRLIRRRARTMGILPSLEQVRKDVIE